MNAKHVIETNNCKAFFFEKNIQLFLGKTKKPTIYRYANLEIALKIINEKIKNYEDNKEKAAVERKQRNEALKKRTEELLSEVKKGQFFKEVFGCTMQRVRYYIVTDVVGKEVFLAKADFKHSDDYGQEGVKTLIGGDANALPCRKAVIKKGAVRLDASMHHWNVLEKVEIGHSDHEWND